MLTKNKNIFQNPRTDFSFKMIFATEKNKRYLIAFLNCFISKYVGEIADLIYLPSEKFGSEFTHKKVVFDIFCTDTRGKNFLIEMQRAPQPEFLDRSIVYLSRALSDSLGRGDRYRIVPTYSVNVLDFELPELHASGDCFQAVFFKNQNNEILTHRIGVFYVNLCNFATSQPEVSDEMRRWIYLLKNMQDMDESDFRMQDGIFRELMEECRITKLSTMEKENYEKSILEYEDVKAAIAYTKEIAEKNAFDKGVEKGIKKGIEKGKNEEKLLIVRNMLSKGLDVDLISEITGISVAEIQEIKE